MMRTRWVFPSILALLLAPCLASLVPAADAPTDSKESKKPTPPPADGEKNKPKEKPAKPVRVEKKRTVAFTPEREAAALRFVQDHHPELGDLLERLKEMNRDEYEQAIGELFQTSEKLAVVKERDPKRYEFMVEEWELKSRCDLLAARIASAGAEELEVELRGLIARQVDLEIRQREYDRDRYLSQGKKLAEQVKSMRDNRDSQIDQRVGRLLRVKNRATTEKPTPIAAEPSAPAKTESQR